MYKRQGRVRAEIFVPEGEKISEKTLNSRLGILGGISILGTTGIVRPMSHDAYIATIRSAVSVADAMGDRTVVLTTGRRSERFAQALFPELAEEAFIQIGDFFQLSLEAVREKKLDRAIHAVFFGKAIKMAQGAPHTHADKSTLSLRRLSQWTLEVSGDMALAAAVAEANTGRHAFFLLQEKAPQVIDHVGDLALAASRSFAGPGIDLRLVIFDFEGLVTFDSASEGQV